MIYIIYHGIRTGVEKMDSLNEQETEHKLKNAFHETFTKVKKDGNVFFIVENV